MVGSAARAAGRKREHYQRLGEESGWIESGIGMVGMLNGLGDPGLISQATNG